MAHEALDTTAFISIPNLMKFSDTSSDAALLTASLPKLTEKIAKLEVYSFALVPVTDIVYNASAVYTNAFRAVRPTAVRAAIRGKLESGVIPAGVTGMLASIMVTRGDAAEESGMLDDTGIEVIGLTEKVLSCDNDTAAADSAQLWYLAPGDTVRIKLVPTGSSGTVNDTTMSFQLVYEYL